MKKVCIFFVALFFLISSNTYGLLKKVNSEELISMIENSKGKVLVVLFWSMWCPLCIEELKVLENIKANSKFNEKLKIISVCLDDSPTKVQNFIKKKKMSLPVFLGKDDVKINFNIIGVPKIYIFDKNNNIVKWQMGYMDKSSLLKIIENLL